MSARANQLLEAGLWLKMSGDLAGARKLFEQALKLDPDSIRARELLGHSVPESEAVPQELRDVPVTRSDLFSVPLPRLFQDEPPAPASIPEEWWNAPPSDGMGNTARFFVRPSAGTPGAKSTIPWGPSPLSPKDDFQGDDMGESGDDFGLELSDGTPSPLSRSGRRPVPVLSRPELVSPAAAASSPTTGAIPLPAEPGGRNPVPGPLPGLFEEPTVVAGPSRTTGAIPLPPDIAPGATSPVPGALRPATTGAIPLPPAATPPPIRPLPTASPVPGPRAEPPRSGGLRSRSPRRLAGAEHSFPPAPLATARGAEGRPDARDPRRRPPAIEGEPGRAAARAVALARAAPLGHARELASDHALARRRSGPASWRSAWRPAGAASPGRVRGSPSRGANLPALRQARASE